MRRARCSAIRRVLSRSTYNHDNDTLVVDSRSQKTRTGSYGVSLARFSSSLAMLAASGLMALLQGKDVLVGVMDVASDTVETPEEVADTIGRALQFVGMEEARVAFQLAGKSTGVAIALKGVPIVRK